MTPRRPLSVSVSPSTAFVLSVFLGRAEFADWVSGQRRNLTDEQWERLHLDVADIDYVAGWHKAWAASDLGSSELRAAEPAPPLSHEITTRDAAAMLRVSDRRVRQLCASGDLDGRRDGLVWLIDRASVELYRPGGVA